MKIIKIEDENYGKLSRTIRKKVTFDNETILYIPTKVFYYHKLKRSKEISDKEYEEIFKSVTQYEWSYVVRWLSAKDRTIFEIRNRLKERKVNDFIIDNIIERAGNCNYIDDDRVKMNIIDSYAKRGYGPVYIRKKIKEKGLEYKNGDLSEIDFIDIARKQFKKYIKSHNGLEERKRKLMGFNYLTRRGFSYGIIKEMMENENE
jgi:regulatory protein